MGRKPVLGLVGACLASVAFVGCDNGNHLQPNKSKDVSAVTGGGSGGTGAWKTTPASQGATTAGTSGAGTTGGSQTWGTTTGATTTGSSGSFNVNTKVATGDYPDGRSVTPQGAATTGGVEHVGYSATPGPDATDAKVIQPPTTTASSAPVAPPAGGLPPLGSQTGAADPKAPAPLSTLPPITVGGTARPKVQDFPPVTSGAPRPVPPPTTPPAPTSGAPDIGGSAPPPPPAPPPVGGPDLGSPDGLPPVPMPPSSESLRKPALPSVPQPRGMGVPASPTTNPASFQ